MQKVEDKEFEIVTHPSGVRCIHRRIDGPVAYVSLTIGAGTRDEAIEQHGVAHMVEHMLFKGTKNYKSYYINSALDSVGGELNAFTAKEETVLHATCALPYVKKGAKLLVDMVFNSLYESKEIEKEKEVIIDEINSYKDTPSELIFDEFEELLFEGSSLGRNILGDKKTIKKVGRDDLVNYCRDNYLPKNMIFAVSSSMTSREFARLCDKTFEGIEAVEGEIKEREKVGKVQPFDITKKKRVAQAHVVIGGYAPSVFENERLAAALLINVIGGPSALSKMNMTLREKYGLTYNAEAAYCPFTDSGFYTLYYSCEKLKVERAKELLMKQLNSFAEVLLKVSTLTKYKKQFIGQLLIANQNSEGAMLALAKSLLLFGTCEASESLVSKIEAITPEDIQKVAREMFAENNLYTLSYQ